MLLTYIGLLALTFADRRVSPVITVNLNDRPELVIDDSLNSDTLYEAYINTPNCTFVCPVEGLFCMCLLASRVTK